MLPVTTTSNDFQLTIIAAFTEFFFDKEDDQLIPEL
jgi:hypothetical protein